MFDFENSISSPPFVRQILKQSTALPLNDPKRYQLLGSIYRQKGSLQKAAAAYKRWATLCPDDQWAKYARFVLSQSEDVQKPPDQFDNIPTPFFKVENALPEDLHDKIFRSAVQKTNNFRLGGVGKKDSWRIDTDTRQIFLTKLDKPLRAEMLEAIEVHLKRSFSRLSIEPFEYKKIQWGINLSVNKSFYKTHQDGLDRKISFSYYFFHSPKRFSGGDLLLYDKKPAKDTFAPGQFTRIKPKNGLLVLFPSSCFHGVTPVRMSATRFSKYGRFSVCGFIS